MVPIRFTIGFLLIVSVAFGQSDSKIKNQQVSNPKTENLLPKYVLFGTFCSECSGICSTMYRYNIADDSCTLFVDRTNSFFKNHRNIACNTPITDASKFDLVDNLVLQIPPRFLTTTKTEETFGCPDCTDGCGIYFEIGQGTTVKKFYIDNIKSHLPNELIYFLEVLETTFTGLRGMKKNKARQFFK